MLQDKPIYKVEQAKDSWPPFWSVEEVLIEAFPIYGVTLRTVDIKPGIIRPKRPFYVGGSDTKGSSLLASGEYHRGKHWVNLL